jgi:hypothetical protein
MYDLERSLYILRISSSSAEVVKTMTDIAFRGLSAAISANTSRPSKRHIHIEEE